MDEGASNATAETHCRWPGCEELRGGWIRVLVPGRAGAEFLPACARHRVAASSDPATAIAAWRSWSSRPTERREIIDSTLASALRVAIRARPGTTRFDLYRIGAEHGETKAGTIAVLDAIVRNDKFRVRNLGGGSGSTLRESIDAVYFPPVDDLDGTDADDEPDDEPDDADATSAEDTRMSATKEPPVKIVSNLLPVDDQSTTRRDDLAETSSGTRFRDQGRRISIADARTEIIAYLRAHPRSKASEIARRTGINSQVIYNAIGGIKGVCSIKDRSSGRLARVYWLPETEPSEVATMSPDPEPSVPVVTVPATEDKHDVDTALDLLGLSRSASTSLASQAIDVLDDHAAHLASETHLVAWKRAVETDLGIDSSLVADTAARTDASLALAAIARIREERALPSAPSGAYVPDDGVTRHLDMLVATGVFGATREEVIVGLVRDGIRRLVEGGVWFRR